MLHETIRHDDFLRNTTLQCWNNVAFVCINVARMLQLKMMLHGTIRNDDFLRNTASQYWNNVVSIQNNVATLCCAKKTSHITSP